MHGKGVAPSAELYDDTWGEVILMSGLPGTGKDTFIKDVLADMPMISLDEIRKEQGILPTGPQGGVADEAKRRAKELLRQKKPFVWNATNITSVMRGQLVDMFTSYGASSRIIYLETPWEELHRRNGARKEEVPADAISRMLDKLTLPEQFEAHRVEWNCV